MGRRTRFRSSSRPTPTFSGWNRAISRIDRRWRTASRPTLRAPRRGTATEPDSMSRWPTAPPALSLIGSYPRFFARCCRSMEDGRSQGLSGPRPISRIQPNCRRQGRPANFQQPTFSPTPLARSLPAEIMSIARRSKLHGKTRERRSEAGRSRSLAIRNWPGNLTATRSTAKICRPIRTWRAAVQGPASFAPNFGKKWPSSFPGQCPSCSNKSKANADSSCTPISGNRFASRRHLTRCRFLFGSDRPMAKLRSEVLAFAS